MNRLKIIILLILTFCFVTIYPCMSYEGIGVKPSFQEVEGNSGEAIKVVYSVYNTGDKPLDVEIYFKDRFKLEENKEIFAKDWISCEQMKFTLGPQETKDIKFIAKVPEEAFGEIMGMIYFCAGSSAGAGIKMSYGVPVYVRIKNTTVIKCNIKDIEIKKETKTPKNIPLHYKALVLFENEGNVHLRPKVKVRLYKDDKKALNVLFPFGKPVFPDGSFNYVSSWDVTEFKLQPGLYVAEAEVTFNGEVLTKKAGFKVDEDGNIHMDKEGDEV